MWDKPDGCFTWNPIYVVTISCLKVELEPHKNCNTYYLYFKKRFPWGSTSTNIKDYKYSLCLYVVTALFMVKEQPRLFTETLKANLGPDCWKKHVKINLLRYPRGFGKNSSQPWNLPSLNALQSTIKFQGFTNWDLVSLESWGTSVQKSSYGASSPSSSWAGGIIYVSSSSS